MIVHHLNTNEFYNLTQEGSRYFIRNENYSAFHAKSDLHSALWDLIDWIRMTNFTNFQEEDCKNIIRIAGTNHNLEKDTVMNIICGRKINRVFYEGAYNLMFQTFSSAPSSTIVLNNETNFFLYEEVIQLLKFSPLKIIKNT